MVMVAAVPSRTGARSIVVGARSGAREAGTDEHQRARENGEDRRGRPAGSPASLRWQTVAHRFLPISVRQVTGYFATFIWRSPRVVPLHTQGVAKNTI